MASPPSFSHSMSGCKTNPSLTPSILALSTPPAMPKSVEKVAAVNATLPKSTRGTPSVSQKSSTIHSALNPHISGAWSSSLAVSVWPVLWLVMPKVAEVSEVAVTLSVTESPALMEKSVR